MNVLSLFDGMSCGRIALDRAGIKVGKYYASEIDKYATKVSEANYPDIIRLGDVTKWQEWNIDWSSIDLVTGGFPCQAWSMAGKQLGDKDERGMLFWTMLDVMKKVREHNPNAHFLIENVKMKKEFEEYITHHTEQELGEVHKILINSALVSAQNRNRYYWTSFECSQPEDKLVFLADIVEKNPESPTIMTDKFCKRNSEILRNDIGGKAKNLSAMEYVKNGMQGDYIIMQTPRGNNSGGVRAKDGKTPTLSANSWEHNNKLAFVNIDNSDYSDRCKKQTRKNGKTPNQKAVALCTNSNLTGSGVNAITVDKVHYRKLTPVECERLQTVPDNYTEVIDKRTYSMYNYKETDNKEDLYLCDVKLMGAKERQEQKSMVNYALCTTSDSLGTELLSCQKLRAIKTHNANIAIERLGRKEVEPEECVIDITKTGSDMATLYMQIKSSLNLGQEVTKSALVVRTSTGKLLRITSAESCQEMRLFTTLIAIKLITQLRICTYVTDRASIHYCIDGLKKSQGSLLSADLSSLKMETIKQTVSNTQRYKMLGNGWTVDVIAHLLGCMK